MRRFGILTVGLAAALAVLAGPVFGNCALPVTFGPPVTAAPGCDATTGICLLENPAGFQNVHGIFYAAGNFVAGPGGVDNGTCEILNCDGGSWITDPTGAGQPTLITGDWGSPSTHGCITTLPANTPMVIEISDYDAATKTAYQAVLTTGGNLEDFGSGWQYHLTGMHGNYVMAPLPRPDITGSSRVPGGVTVNVAGVSNTDAANGYYPATESTLVTQPTAAQMYLGYRVYQQGVPENGPAPGSRDPAAGWTPVSAVVPLGQPVTTDQINCAAATDVYLATSLILAGGGQTRLSGDAVRVKCNSTLADPGTPGNRPDRPPVDRGRGKDR